MKHLMLHGASLLGLRFRFMVGGLGFRSLGFRVWGFRIVYGIGSKVWD